MARLKELLAKEIKPNLKKGVWIICDRFRDSTTAYQGYGNDLKLNILEIMQDSIFNKFHADLTIILWFHKFKKLY